MLTVLDRYLLATEFERNIEKQSPTADQAAAVMANVQAFRLIASRHEGSIDAFLDSIDPLIDSSAMEPPQRHTCGSVPFIERKGHSGRGSSYLES